jgi:hypothetical protein
MKSLSILYERLICLGLRCPEARQLCKYAEFQLHQRGRFEVPAVGGYVIGSLTNHGVRLGK